MSGLIVGLVLRTPISGQFNTEAKFVATVYADHAWEDGTHAHPAVDTVARITGLSGRTVQRYLRTLEIIGVLIPDGKGPKGTNQYKFPLENGQDGFIRLAIRKGDSLSPRQAVRGDSALGDTDSGDTHRVTLVSPESINNPIDNDDNSARVFKAYEANIGVIVPNIADAIETWLSVDKVPADWIVEAIDLAVQYNSRNWKYIEAILKRWQAKGKDAPKPKGETHGKSVSNRGGRPVEQAAPTDADREAAELVRQRKQGSRV